MTEKKPRVPSETTLKVRAFAKVERARARLTELAIVESSWKAAHSVRVDEAKRELTEAENAYAAFVPPPPESVIVTDAQDTKP